MWFVDSNNYNIWKCNYAKNDHKYLNKFVFLIINEDLETFSVIS